MDAFLTPRRKVAALLPRHKVRTDVEILLPRADPKSGKVANLAHPYSMRTAAAAPLGTDATRAAAFARLLPRALMTLAVAVMLFRAFASIDGRTTTSDESLYLSEAVSIGAGHVEYASGEPIVHRPPLYPAMLAPVMAATGNDVDAARMVPIVCALGALAALFWLASLLFGRDAAALAVAIAAVAETQARLTTGFFTDVPAAMWLIASAAALITAHRRDDMRWFAAAGTMLALSFWTKETAIAWLPLPLALALIDPPARPKRGIAIFGVVFALLVAPWFAWVWWHTGVAFKVDGTLALALSGAALSGAAVAVAIVAARAPWPRGRAAIAMATALTLAWGALMLAVLVSRPEPNDTSYWRSLPSWTAQILAPNMQPWPLIAPAWAWLAWRVAQGGRGLAMPLLLAGFGSAVLVYVANMGWEPRQVVWLAYLSYAVLAWALIEATSALAARWRWTDATRATLVGGMAATCAVFAAWNGGWRAGDTATGPAADWQSTDEQAIAGWLRELPPGSPVLASRLYSAQLYTDSGGSRPVRQLPTLGVTLDDSGAVRPFGTMFRYEDAATDLGAPRTWIGLRPHALGAYSVALAEEDLLASIRHSGASHLLLTGDDGGFSSLAYRPYFEAHPAFTLERADEDGEIRAYLYAIDAARLDGVSPPLMLSLDDLVPLLTHRRSGEATFWRAVAPHGVLLDGQLLDPADMASLAR